MSNIIQLLEKMGQDASLQTPEAYQQAIATSGLSDELKAVLAQQTPQNLMILAPDENNAKALLEKELNVTKPVCGLILPADDDDGSEQDSNAEKSRLEHVA